ncbi:hypothetical protein [Kitasatospora putterlickiae]|uniref:hypothetical protein n=1 Tax=Kitasatospora putterlickiae TaxID=221725 RepID=UPI0031D02F16
MAQNGLAKGVALPLQSYMLGYPSRVAVQKAQLRVQRECMARLGFDYNPPAPGLHPPPNFDGANMARRYGITVREEAEKTGYHLAADSGPAPLFEPSQAESVALRGQGGNGEKPADARVPEGGCLGEGARQVGELDETLVDQLNGESLERSRTDPAVTKVFADWSACMKTKGFTVTDPLTATEQLPSRGAREATAQEVLMAVADVACKSDTSLVRIWADTETRIQNEQIAQNQLALSEIRDKNDATLSRAAAR